MKVFKYLLAALCVLCLNKTLIAQVNPTDTLQEDLRYKTALKNYQKGEKDYSEFPFMVEMANRKHNSDFAALLALDYVDNFLLKLTENKLYTRDNLNFIRGNLQTSDSKAFRMFYEQPTRIDSVIGQQDAANAFVRYIVNKEETAPAVANGQRTNTVPDWKGLHKQITVKYDQLLADRIVMESRMYWFGVTKQYSEYAHALVLRVEKYGAFGMFGIASQYNQIAWSIFLNTGNKNDLKAALAWSGKSVKASPDNRAIHLDTYANILYRLGRTKEAIDKEETALKLDPDLKIIQENLVRMKAGQDTWDH